MLKKLFNASVIAALGVLLVACEDGGSSAGPQPGSDGSEPWYTTEQVRLGRQVFKQNCASCHGGMAQGAPNWRERGPDGNFPPPPLNGSGHTWHHPFPMLRDIITDGGQQNMPAFGDRLSDKEIEAVLAFVNSLWPDRVYETWVTQVNDR